MTSHDPVRELLHSAIPPVAGGRPSRDLLPLVVDRIESRAGWSWIDAGLAAVLAILLTAFPQCLGPLAFHL